MARREKLMFDTCLHAAGECDWFYEDEKHETQSVDTVDHTCCECGSTIAAGTEHDLYVGTRPKSLGSRIDAFCTCVVCMRIWDSLADGERVFEGLNELLGEAYGLELNKIPDDDEPPEPLNGVCLHNCEMLTVRDGQAWCAGYRTTLVTHGHNATACTACLGDEEFPQEQES